MSPVPPPTKVGGGTSACACLLPASVALAFSSFNKRAKPSSKACLSAGLASGACPLAAEADAVHVVFNETFPAEGDSVAPRAWFEGLVACHLGDEPAAQCSFAAARAAVEAKTAGQPANARTLTTLARIDALLGRKADALREARSACEKLPAPANAYYSVPALVGLARSRCLQRLSRPRLR